jgi:hypothetical protein
MTGIFFYSILIFILLSIFVPSIYNYAYSCFIGRVVLVLLIIYFSKHSILLGLLFVAIIIITSMPLYEGFSLENKDILAKNYLVTSNTSIKDTTSNREVSTYLKKYYCAKNSSSPNQDKLKRWNDIKRSGDKYSRDIASANILLQSALCSGDNSQYYQNYNNNWRLAYPSGFNPLYSNVNPNSISGCSHNGNNHVLNMPQCLPESIKKTICDNSIITSTITSGRNVSNNPKLDPYLQQDAQWMLNAYSQLCK